MNYDIHNNKGAGPLLIGISRDEARSCMEDAPTSFKRSPQAHEPCDYYEMIGVFIYYKSPGLIEAIEVSSPSAVMYQGVDLLSIPFAVVKNYCLLLIRTWKSKRTA